ncbi:hypothetical protein DBL06_25310 [Agrobacterium pusense]|nr:hypothetical protein DBL06_25310 [Agrobacterium pusense]
MDPNGDHPHVIAPPDMTSAINERFAARDEEKAWLARLESGKEANTAAPTAGTPSGKSSEVDEARVRAGAGEHHRNEQRGWAEYANTEAAGERQHDSEERRRSNGMSL